MGNNTKDHMSLEYHKKHLIMLQDCVTKLKAQIKEAERLSLSGFDGRTFLVKEGKC